MKAVFPKKSFSKHSQQLIFDFRGETLSTYFHTYHGRQLSRSLQGFKLVVSMKNRMTSALRSHFQQKIHLNSKRQQVENLRLTQYATGNSLCRKWFSANFYIIFVTIVKNGRYSWYSIIFLIKSKLFLLIQILKPC